MATPEKKKQNVRITGGMATPECLPRQRFNSWKQIIHWGRDNLLPNRHLNAVANSPTASGVAKRYGDFVAGEGFVSGGDTVVNRRGQTLDDMLMFASRQRALFGSFTLHFNFNLLGQIAEIQEAKMHLSRVSPDLLKIHYQDWTAGRGLSKTWFPIYHPGAVGGQIEAAGSFDEFEGALYWKPENLDVYPEPPGMSANPSAELEANIQTISLAFARNGFKGSGVLKLPPSSPTGAEDDGKERAEIDKLSDPASAGSFVEIEMPTNSMGDNDDVKVFEAITLPNIDKMFEQQHKMARNYILQAGTLPEPLLNSTTGGLFAEGGLEQAFTFFSATTAGLRADMERRFSAILSDSAWAGLGELEIDPLGLDAFVAKPPAAPAPGPPNPRTTDDETNRDEDGD